MEKPLLTALLFLCMPLSLLARKGSFLPATADTTSPIITTLVVPPSRAPGATIPATTLPRPPVTLQVFNNSATQDLFNIFLEWVLLVNGITRQKGTFGPLLIPAHHTGIVRLPVKMPSGANDEVFLQIRYTARKKGPPAQAGKPTGAQGGASPAPLREIIAEDQLLLKPWSNGNLPIPSVPELTFIDEDGLFIIQSSSLRARFDKQTGWLQQYEVNGFRLLENPPGLFPDGWQPAGSSPQPPPGSSLQQPPYTPRLQLFSTSTGDGIVIVKAEYLLPEIAGHLHLGYTLNAAGEMQVEQSIEIDSTLRQTGTQQPAMEDSIQNAAPGPRFGMQWAIPAGLDSITWYGPGPATIGVTIGIYRQIIQPPAPLPSTGIRWCKITGGDGKGLLITADSALLNISFAPRPNDEPGRLLNIGHPITPASPGTLSGKYHYIYKVTPLAVTPRIP